MKLERVIGFDQIASSPVTLSVEGGVTSGPALFMLYLTPP